MLDDKKSGMDILPKIITNSTLIGYGNKSFDDILLNFLHYHKESTNNELWTVVEMINKQKESGHELWRHDYVEFYMNKHVDSIDLSEFINLDCKPILSDNTNTLINDGGMCCEIILDGLNRFLEANNHGFRSRVTEITSESVKLNYVLRKII